MKKCLSILLVIAMLIPGFACAETAAPAYEPGSVIHGLFADAFMEGKMLCADVDAELALNAEALGMTGEDAEILDAVVEIVNTAIIGGAVVNHEDGLILSLGADYVKEGEAGGASAEARICLNQDGLYIETSLLPGERVTAKWETVLMLLGADEATVQQVLSLRGVDFEMLMAQAQQMAEQVLPVVQQAAMPYLNILTEFLGSLPVTVEENVAAENYFPAAKEEVTFTLSAKMVGELFIKLADQLENDVTVAPALGMMLASPEIMGDNVMTVGALCESIRMAAAGMTDEEYPVHIFFGYGEDDALLYASVVWSDNANMTLVLNVVDSATEGEAGSGCIVEAFMLDAEEAYSGASVSWYMEADPADQNVFDLAIAADVTIQNTSLLSIEYAVGNATMTTEENMPGYSGYQSMTASVVNPESGEPVNVVSSAEFSNYLTADGGEEQVAYGTTDTYVGEASTQSVTESYFAAIPTEDGPAGRYASFVAQPANGVDSALIDVSLYALPYHAPEQISVLALENAAQEEIDALLGRLMTGAQEPLEALISQLPPVILEAMGMAEAPADTAQ